MRILIVDDNPLNRKWLRDILQSGGFEVAEADDGESAMKALDRASADCIITDVLMPGMDGYRLCFELRQRERLKGIPVIIFTSTYTSPADEEFAMALGADRFVRQPVAAAELLAVLRSIRRPSRKRPVRTLNELGVVREYNTRLVAKLQEKNAELRRQTEELKLARQQLASFFTAATAGLCILDSEFRFVQISDKLAAMNGPSVEDHLGRRIRDVLPKIGPQLESICARVFESGKPLLDVQTSGEVPSEPGVKRHWVASYFPIPATGTKPRFIGAVVVEVTERKKAEERIAFQASLLDQVRNAILATDANHLIVYWNTFAERLYQWREDEVVGKEAARLLVPPESYQAAAEIVAEIDRSGFWEGELSLQRKDGSRFFAEIISVAMRDSAGNVIGRVSVTNDVTARKVAEERLRQSQIELRALAARLHEVREEESLRLARKIHDVLGQNLTSLNLDLNWLQEKVLAAPGLPSPGRLKQRFKSMASLLETTVRSVQQIASELRPGVLDDLGLAAALEWQAQDFAHRARIQCRWKSKPTHVGLGSRQDISLFRIFQECLTNVARHARARHVTLEFSARNGNLVLEVADDGRGFNSSKLVDRQSLGLLGMRERAMLIGGRLEFDSTPGRGTTVRLTLPSGKGRTSASKLIQEHAHHRKNE